MKRKYEVEVTAAIVIDGAVRLPGSRLTLDHKLARNLLARGKCVLVEGAGEPDDADTDPAAMTVAQLRAELPNAPARATKAELVALVIAQREAEA